MGLLKNIDLIVYDFDGVMTDNRVLLSEDGLESVFVNRSDGLAVEIIKKLGVRQIILSKEKNKVVVVRAKKIDVPVLSGVDQKEDALVEYCRANSIKLENVLYIGNDINDIDVMKKVGFPACPADAYKEIKDVSKIIFNTPGGYGVIRELLAYL